MRRRSITERERDVVRQLQRDGVVAVEGYWSRDEAFQVRDRLTGYIGAENADFDCGAYARVWSSSHPKLQDSPEEDQGITRIYHVDKLLPELAKFRFDPFVLDVASAYYRVPIYSGMLQFQYNRQDTAETRYYHVDAFEKEFKAFLYLDDVDIDNGPFTYLRGSQRAALTRIKKQILGNRTGSGTSFYPEDLGRWLNRETRITGPAGTLILADVRGFHRGSPQRGSSRCVLVNYMYQWPVEPLPDR
jgi:hypothetical protein